MTVDDAPQIPRLVDIEEASRQLCLGRSAIYQLIETRELTRIKLGKKVCFLQSELSDFINRKVAEARHCEAA